MKRLFIYLTVIFSAVSAAVASTPETESDKEYSHFAWGADIGSGIDMTGNDMTSIDLNAFFGYKNQFIRFLGVGAGIDMMISNGSSAYPLYAMFRSGFSNRPTFLFLDARAGCSINNIQGYDSKTNFFGSLGIGFTLARGKNFSSHIILSYNFMPIGNLKADETVTHFDDLHYAALRIGASF